MDCWLPVCQAPCRALGTRYLFCLPFSSFLPSFLVSATYASWVGVASIKRDNLCK